MINDERYKWPDEKEEATKFVKKTYALCIIGRKSKRDDTRKK